MMGSLLVYILGFIAQSLFSVRMFVQWIMSERSKKVVSPVIFWQLSLIASFLFLIYGWLRADFAIILGQFFSFYIYIWNLNVNHRWNRVNGILRFILMITPPAVICIAVFTVQGAIGRLWSDISLGLLLFGSAGQTLFAFRFIYQWLYSRRFNRSILPNGFWILSIAGSISILVYGIIRKDPVLILGQGAGFIMYSRNLFLNSGKNANDLK
jgi:lipid-A-disaccharide synthase-like uncharacterized protein